MLRLASATTCLALCCLPLSEPPPVHGCAAAWRGSEPVGIAEEGAVIIWDAARKVQHFIRWAGFDSEAPDFGFLVPTPTQPTLADAPDNVFDLMETWTAPTVVERRDVVLAPMFCMFGCGKSDFKAKSVTDAVRVLDRQRVGGFDAAVLEADDAEALRGWLDQHGYVARPELISWLGPYLADRWKITAFKIARDADTGRSLQTTPVRMTFRTERPFFPYREPEEPKEVEAAAAATKQKQKVPIHQRGRLLRVFFIGDQRVEGMLGNDKWTAGMPWSNVLSDAQRTDLIERLGLPDNELPARPRLTVFEDLSSPRPGREEVYFRTAADQSVVTRPDRVLRRPIWIPIDVVLLGLIGLAVVLWRWKGRNDFSRRQNDA